MTMTVDSPAPYWTRASSAGATAMVSRLNSFPASAARPWPSTPVSNMRAPCSIQAASSAGAAKTTAQPAARSCPFPAAGTGDYNTCVVLNDGRAQCWGENDRGEVGDGTTEARWSPVDVIGLGGEVSMISMGGSFACALLEDGRVQCWGNNRIGQCGDGTQTARTFALLRVRFGERRRVGDRRLVAYVRRDNRRSGQMLGQQRQRSMR